MPRWDIPPKHSVPPPVSLQAKLVSTKTTLTLLRYQWLPDCTTSVQLGGRRAEFGGVRELALIHTTA